MAPLPAHDHPAYGLARRVRLAQWLDAPRDGAAARRRLREFHQGRHTLPELVEAALDLGTAGLYEVKASQIRSEIAALAGRVAQLRPQVIVEIGVYKGGTGFLWSQLADDLVVLCDLRPLWLERNLFAQFPRQSGPALRVLTGDSHDPRFRAQLVTTLAGRPIDFLFLDGDHSLAGIRQDFADYAPLVRAGGLIACHDIVPQQPFPTTQVHLFWQEILAAGNYRTTEYVEDWGQTGYGIGVIEVG